MKTIIDWGAKTAPWCWIGPAFHADVEAIVSGKAPPWGGRNRIHDDAATRLRDNRIKAGLTQSALAQQSGVSRSTINCMENGIGSISGNTWGRVERALAAILHS